MLLERLFNAFGKKAVGQIAAAVIVPPLVCLEFINIGLIPAAPGETLHIILIAAGLGLIVGTSLVLIERRGRLFFAMIVLIGLVALIIAFVFVHSDFVLYWRLNFPRFR